MTDIPQETQTFSPDPHAPYTVPDDIINGFLGEMGLSDTDLPEEPVPAEPETPTPETPVTPDVEEEDEEAPPVPPGGPIFPPEPGEETAAGDPWADFDTRVANDPGFRLALMERLGIAPTYPPPSPTIPTAPQPVPNLPPMPAVSQEDFEDNPAAQALLFFASRQQAELQQLREQLGQFGGQLEARRAADATEAVNTARSLFQRQYNLPDEIMRDIEQTAAQTAAPLYQHHLTAGLDPVRATEKVLEQAYWNTASARRYEIDRQQTHRAKTAERKKKLGGIAGSSASATRNPQSQFDESTPQGREAAAVAFLAAAMGEEE